METSISLPLDDGFLRRECPACERQFKWFSGDTEDKPLDVPDPDQYYCPYCGEAAAPDTWWTPEQLEYARTTALNAAGRPARSPRRAWLEALGKTGLVSVSIDGGDAAEPSPLVEPNDMVIVEPPCHSYEPIKVDEDWTAPIHCIICGREYTL